MNKLLKTSVCLAVMAIALPVSAKQLWSDFSVSYLQGNDNLEPFSGNEFGSKVITVEHASGHDWGSTFIFFDRATHDNGSNDEVYGEMSANLSLAKAFNDDRDGKFIKDYFVTGQIEHQSQDRGFNNYLYGGGVDLNVPGANYFNIILYRRNQDDFGIGKKDNNQLTFLWSFDLTEKLRVDGFWDITDSYDTNFGKSKGESHFTPQIKYNVGPALGITSGRLDVGLEYTYWINKFGVDGQDEKSPNLLVKWHF